MKKKTYKLSALLLITCMIAGCSAADDKAGSEDSKTSGSDIAVTTVADQLPGTETDGADGFPEISDELAAALVPTAIESDIDFLSLSGRYLNGAEFTGAVFADYDMTIIDCWMTWCMPCADGMPYLNKASKNIPENTQMMGICFDGVGEEATCRQIVGNAGVTYPTVVGNQAQGMPFSIGDITTGVPTLLFVNREGQCFARFIGRPVTDELDEQTAYEMIIDNAYKMMDEAK